MLGHPGYYIDIRKLHYLAQTYCHDKAKSLYWWNNLIRFSSVIKQSFTGNPNYW